MASRWTPTRSVNQWHLGWCAFLLLAVLVPHPVRAGWTGTETFNSTVGSSYGVGQSFAGDKGSWSVTANVGILLLTDNTACLTGTRAVFASSTGANLRSPTFSGGVGTVSFSARGSVTSVKSLPSNTSASVSTDSSCQTVNAVFNITGDNQFEIVMLNGGVVDNVTVTDAASATVLSTGPASANPTKAASTIFSVDFSQAVTSPSTSNFSLTTSGVTGASITSVEAGFDATSWVVNVSTGTGDGTIRLDLANGTGITPPVSNVPYTSGGLLYVDKSAPQSQLTVSKTLQVGGAVGGSFTASDSGGGGLGGVNLYRRGAAPGSAWQFVASISTGPTTSGSWSYTPSTAGTYEFSSSGFDNANNSEPNPSVADGVVSYNTTANGTVTEYIPLGDSSWTFAMEEGPPAIFATLAITAVTSDASISVGRSEGDAAPSGVDSSLLIDQSLSINPLASLVFTTATLTLVYEEALLGGVAEEEITTAYRESGETITTFPAIVDTGANTITVESIDGFSTWYFGKSPPATPTPTVSPSPTDSPTATATASPSLTASPTSTPVSSPTASPSPTATTSPTASASPSATPEPTLPPTSSPTPSPTSTPTPTATAVPTASPTPSVTASPTPAPSEVILGAILGDETGGTPPDCNQDGVVDVGDLICLGL